MPYLLWFDSVCQEHKRPEVVNTERVGRILKDSARFATTAITPWFLVVFGMLGGVDFSQPTKVVRAGLIAWIVAALVSIPFDVGLHAIQHALTRKRGGQKGDKGV